MKHFVVAPLLAFFLIENGFFTSTRNQASDKVFSITVATEEEAATIRNVSSHPEVVLWQPDSPQNIKAGTETHLYIPGSSVERIKELLHQNGVKHTVLLENVQELIDMQTKNDSNDPRSSVSFYERYHPLDEIYSWINKTAQDNPHLVRTILIGSTFEKRPLYVLKLSGRNPSRAMWMDCGIHAREWISPAFCLWFVQYVIQFYNTNPEITQILDNMDIYILPVLNPDGYLFTWTNNRMWRKNRSQYEDSDCIGADLNRNFDANWCTEGSSPRPCDETYCGPFPESESETKAVATFLRSKKHIMKLYISIHSYSQMLLFPYSYTYKQADNHNELFTLAREAALKIKRHYGNHYRYGAGAKTIYLAPGGSDDWAYDIGIDYSFTFELRDRGQYGFLLPPSYIAVACNEALTAVKSIATGIVKKMG
nr:PREDICTED: carboxypeptidase B2 [Lepisosteus oculatus]